MRNGLAFTALTLLSLAACSERGPAPAPNASANADTTAVGEEMTPAARAQLDSGNTAFSAGNFQTALRHYRAAADQAPGIASPWYGISMAAGQLGNTALADSAMTRVRALMPNAELPAHPDTAATRRSPGG